MRRRAVAAAALMLMAVHGDRGGALPPAQAAEHVRHSLITSLDLKACTVPARRNDRNGRICRGLPGYPVYVAEAGGRTFVSVGERAAARRAATQTLKAPNTLFEAGGKRSTIEWRVKRGPGRPIPYAVIVRFLTSGDGGRKGEVLVVSRVTSTATCHMAYIDALANPEGIALARRIADEQAATFDCSSEPAVEGEPGQSPL